MILIHVGKSLKEKPILVIAAALLLCVAMTLLVLSSTLIDVASYTPPRAHITVALPHVSSDSEQIRDVINHISNTSAHVIGTDRRVVLKAYSDEVTACVPSVASVHTSDLDICVFAVKLSGMETVFQNVIGKRYQHNYDFEITQILALYEIYTDVSVGSNLQLQIVNDMREEDWAKIGNTYLVWGRLARVDRNGESTYQLTLVQEGRRKLIDTDGLHLAYVQNSGETVPLISQIDSTVEAFNRTEMGQTWQDLVLPATNVLYHSLDVVCTNIPDSIRAFNSEETVLTDGEMLSAAQCEQGERVCLVSEELARLNGWSVNDSISLGMYDGTRFPTVYHTTAGFFCERSYRIVGVYCNAQDYVNSAQGVHPNTVFIPYRSVDPLPADSTDFSLVIEEGSENAFETEMQGMGYGGLFSYQSGPEPENVIEQIALTQAREEWLERTEERAYRLRITAVILIALACFAMMQSSKREIGCLYTLETANHVLFGHVLLQIAIIGTVSAIFVTVVSQWWLPDAVSELLYRLADADFADRLMQTLPSVPMCWISLLSGLGITLLFGAAFACIATKRSYYYVYKEGGDT